MGQSSHIINTLLDLLTEGNWRGIRAVFLLLVITAVLFFAYDYYTASFTFGRLDKAADLISKMQQIESGGKLSPELDRIYATLRLQADEAVNHKPLSINIPEASLSVGTSHMLKFTAGGAIWVLLSLLTIRKMFRREPKSISQFAGFLAVATIFGFIGLLLPPFFWPWGNLVVYPILQPVVMLVLVGIYGYQEAKKQIPLRPKQTGSNAA